MQLGDCHLPKDQPNLGLREGATESCTLHLVFFYHWDEGRKVRRQAGIAAGRSHSLTGVTIGLVLGGESESESV